MKKSVNREVIQLDALPKYSNWISCLLGLSGFNKPFDKNVESIAREYNVEKWGVLFENLQLLKNPTVSIADSLLIEKKKNFFL